MAALSGVAAVPVSVTVNGTSVQVPYITPAWSIKYDGQYVRYQALFGFSVAFDGQWSITVNVPSTAYFGKMCGMCGDNDNNATNDLTTANGTYVGDLPDAGNLVGDSYAVPDPMQTNSGLCPAAPQPQLCDPLPQSYLSVCELINSSSNVFSACIGKLGQTAVDALMETCLMDACFTNGLSLCFSIQSFVDLCTFNGAPLPCSSWQTASNCSAENLCPPGMIYQCSAPACQATCTDPDASDACPFPNKDACVCPPGQLLDNGTCTSNCPAGCLDSNNQLRQFGEQWAEPGCVFFKCDKCDNCTSLQAASVTNGCPTGKVCVNNIECLPVTTAMTTTTTSNPLTLMTPTCSKPPIKKRRKKCKGKKIMRLACKRRRQLEQLNTMG